MFRPYLKDISGNIAITFAVCSLMLLSTMGAAIDFNNIFRKKTTYQSLADIAALAAAGSGEDIESKLREIAIAAVNANNFADDTLKTELTITDEGRVQVIVSGTYDTIFMSIFGKPHQDISVLAEAVASGGTHFSAAMDIALVLDTTASMAGSKLDALKTAAGALVVQLESYDVDSIRVSVIPFSEYVNVGLSRRNEPWIDVPADNSTALQACQIDRDLISSTNCVTTLHNDTCETDGVYWSCSYETTTCDEIYGPQYLSCYNLISVKEWHGCVGSRLAPWNKRAHKGNVAIPGLLDEVGLPGTVKAIKCVNEILPLTKDMSVVRAKIDSLTAKDLTYLPAGLIWGWRALQPEAPLIEAGTVQAGSKTSVLIFMTDGGNTVSQDGKQHGGTDIDQANKRTEDLCDNIKNDKIKIYTVAYDFNGADTLRILKDCATKRNMSFLASNAAGLQKVFEDIGDDLFELRLTR